MSRSLRTILNEANPNKLPSAMQLFPAGNAFGRISRFIRAAVPVGTGILTLPNNAKAAKVIKAYVTAGTTKGLKTPIPGATVATTQVGITPTGDIQFNVATDAVTAAEVDYMPAEGPVISELISVAASIGTLLQTRAGHTLISVAVVTGVIAGAKIVDARGTAAPAAGHAALTDLGLTILFNAADVVAGTALVTYVAQPGVGTTPAPVGETLDLETQGF